MARNDLLALLRGGVAPVAEPNPKLQSPIEEEMVPIKLEPSASNPKTTGQCRRCRCRLPTRASGVCWMRISSRNSGPRRSLIAPIEPQLHRVYDAVYELATLMLKQ